MIKLLIKKEINPKQKEIFNFKRLKKVIQN